jgi:hypothetical protein
VEREYDNLRNRCLAKLAKSVPASADCLPLESWKRILPFNCLPIAVGFFDWRLRQNFQTLPAKIFKLLNASNPFR